MWLQIPESKGGHHFWLYSFLYYRVIALEYRFFICQVYVAVLSFMCILNFKIWKRVSLWFPGCHVFMTLILPEHSESLNCKYMKFVWLVILDLIFFVKSIWQFYMSAWIFITCVPGHQGDQKISEFLIMEQWKFVIPM